MYLMTNTKIVSNVFQVMYNFDDLTVKVVDYADKVNSEDEKEKKTYHISLDQLQAAIFCHLMTNNQTYQTSAVCYWTAGRSKSTVLVLDICPMLRSVVDHLGCALTSSVLWRFIEQDDALHWLSTLGGAFSNLGESRPEFAMKAGRNARKQLLVGLSTGDVSQVARCHLFIAHSLIQLGELRAAGRLLRSVWRSCHSSPLASLAISHKLSNMCRGIWSRLKYERRREHSRRSAAPSVQELDQEIELKFQVPDDYRSSLESVQASFVSEILLDDTYFDTEHLDLLRQDVWLRKRGETWEIKIPLADNFHTKGMTQYREVLGLPKIKTELKKFVSQNPEELNVLVKVSSKRENWKLKKFNIVIDRILDDGWTIGEIELMNKSSDSARDSKTQIEDLGRKLGFKPYPFGKVTHCLESQAPEAWKILSRLSNET